MSWRLGSRHAAGQSWSDGASSSSSWQGSGFDWNNNSSFWHDQNTWWRDPKEMENAVEIAGDVADDNYTFARVEAVVEHGVPNDPGSFFGGQREGWRTKNHPRQGQQRGTSGAKTGKFPSHQVYKVHLPVSIKEAGYWWTDVKALANNHDDIKVSFRALRFSPDGPGWNEFNVIGPGGKDFMEDALKALLIWRPDFDIDAVAFPVLGDEFPTQEVRDVVGNVKERALLREGETLVDAAHLLVSVQAHAGNGVVLRRRKHRCTDGKRRKMTPEHESENESKPTCGISLKSASCVGTDAGVTASVSGVTASEAAVAPSDAGVTASGIRVKSIDFKGSRVKIPVNKVFSVPVSVSNSAQDIPPFYDMSLKELDVLRAQQKLNTCLGA